MIKRPLLVLLAAFALGVVLKDSTNIVIGVALLIYVFLLLALKLNKNFEAIFLRKNLILVFLPAFMLFGALDAGWQSCDYDIDLALLQTKSGKAEGYISGKVESVTASQSGYKIVLKDVVIFFENQYFHDGKALLYFNDSKDASPDAIKIGNKIEAIGTVKELAHAENPGQYDEKAYYRAKGISCKFYVDNYEISEDSCRPVLEKCRRIREKMASVYDRLFPEEEAGIMKAVVLGDKSTLSEDTRELYKNNGIGHILAISGLHVSLVGNGLFRLLRACKLSLPFASFFTAALLVLYGIITGFGVSTIRAVFMLIVGLIAKIIGRSYDSCSACAICGLGILIIQPLQLYQTGFQLSFAASIGIGLFGLEFKKWKAGELYGTGLKPLFGKLVRANLSALSPQLVTTPIILKTYYELPTYSLLMNILVLPFMGIVVTLGLLCGLIGISFEKVGQVLNFPLSGFLAGGAYYLLRFYKWLCKTMSALPAAMLLYGNPSRVRLILNYSLILLFFFISGFLARKHIRDKKAFYYRRRAALVLCIIPFLFIKTPYKGLGVNCLSVGQGDCSVLQITNNTAFMIDGGSSSVNKISKYRIEPFLKYSGIDTLEAIFITHPDKDHISGIEELLENIDNSASYKGTVRVKRIIITPEASKSEKLANIISLAKEKNIEIVSIMAGDTICFNDVRVTCLAPDSSNDNADNDGSIVLLAQYGDFDAVFMGDSAGPGETAVLSALQNKAFEAPVDFIKIAHHGSKNASSDNFLEALNPTIAVLSYGRGNVYGHPHQRVVIKLTEMGTIVYKTGQSGAGCFKIHKK